MEVTISNYQHLAMRTAKPLETQKEKLIHAALGLGSEVGEYSLSVSKSYQEGYNDNVSEELGDIMWYIALLCDALDIQIMRLADNEEHCLMQFRDEFCIERPRSHHERHLALSFFAGEVQTIVKGHVYYGKPLAFDAIVSAAKTTLGLVFLAGAAFGLTGDNLMAANISKLSKRYPNAFSDEDAVARADKQ